MLHLTSTSPPGRRLAVQFLTLQLLAATAWVTSMAANFVAADEKKVSVSEPPADVSLKAGTWKDVEALVAANPGRIVVVDIWSTSCLPCITEFPNLITLQKTHGDKIVCVSFNVDYVGIKSKPPETYRERVEKFLKKEQAEIPNFLCSLPSDAVFEELKLTSIPAAYVFGRDGKLAKRFDDSLLVDGKEEAFTYAADINPFVKTLLSANEK